MSLMIVDDTEIPLAPTAAQAIRRIRGAIAACKNARLFCLWLRKRLYRSVADLGNEKWPVAEFIEGSFSVLCRDGDDDIEVAVRAPSGSANEWIVLKASIPMPDWIGQVYGDLDLFYGAYSTNAEKRKTMTILGKSIFYVMNGYLALDGVTACIPGDCKRFAWKL